MLSNAECHIRPPIDGSLTLPETLSFHEKHNADVSVYAFSEAGQDGITEISYGQFARACRRAPWVLGLCAASSPKPVVALMALSDTMVYQATLVGVMNAGYIPFPISPRNSAQAIANLLQKVDCHHILTTCSTRQALIGDIVEELQQAEKGYGLTISEMPTTFQLFSELSDEADNPIPLPYDTNADIKPHLDDIALYLHSSGSTGLPKAIPKTHRQLLEFVTFPAPVYFREHTPRVRMACMHLPPYHALGMICQIFLPLFSGISAALYPPSEKLGTGAPMLPTPDNILEHVQKTKTNALTAIPTLLQIWAQNQASIDILSSMIQVRFSGGPLSHKIGKLLVSNGVKLKSSYGGTEFGAPAASSLKDDDEHDWEYVEFSEMTKIRWIPQGDGTYECQCLTCDTHHVSVENLSDTKGYATADIFVPHPTKNLWKVVGRLDDVIVHSSGEKTVPLPMECIILSCPHISGAVMFGHGHDQPGVLIEPGTGHEVDVDDMEQVARFRNLIWPFIEEANHVAPAFSRVFKELILVVDKKNKPLPRAGKGTVTRKGALGVYAPEIELLYASIEFLETVESVDPPSVWDREHITQWLLDQAGDLYPDRSVNITGNLFELGFDSLSATILRRRISGALKSSTTEKGGTVIRSINPNTIYNFPTIDSLANRLLELLVNPTSTENLKSHVDAIKDMIGKYSFTEPIRTDFGEKPGKDIAVLLTGSTGSLGSQILEKLLRDPRISKIYALNRPSAKGISSAERHLHRFRDKELDGNLLQLPKLIFLESNYGEKNIGLPDSLYSELSTTVNIVIHTAWKLDFNLFLASFESHIRGTHNLIKFARGSVYGSDLKFIFASSVGVAQSWDTSKGLYPEEVLSDTQYAVGNGYGESKYVVERILATSGINATCLRIGQITGAQTNGAWSTTDWVPILVKSSLAMGALPTANGNATWIPVNAVAEFIQELIFHTAHYPPAFNVVHSNPVGWNQIMEHFDAILDQTLHLSLPLISFQKWFQMLEGRWRSASIDEVMKIPAIKLRDFFKRLSDGDLVSQDGQVFGAAKFETTRTKDTSEILARLPPLSRDNVSKWVEYWIHANFLIAKSSPCEA